MSVRFPPLFSILFLPLVLVARLATAAPCCSGSLAFPALILTDDRTQVGMRVSHGAIIGDVAANGVSVFRGDNDFEDTWMGRVDGAYRLTDRFQMGVSLPWVWHSVSRGGGSISGASQGLGDVMLNLGYEAWPEWNYSKWMPQGFVFFQWTLPTGRTLTEARNSLMLDATGLGMHGLTLGTLFIKRFSGMDASLNADLSTYLPLENRTTSQTYLGLRLGGGVGWSFAEDVLRLGTRLQGSLTTPKGSGQSGSRVWDTGLELGYQAREDLSMQLAYSDQTLLSFFGPPQNVTLSRVLALSVQMRTPL